MKTSKCTATKLFLFFIPILIISCKENKVMIKPPVAEKIAKELTIHGDTRIDNYYWLNERGAEKVEAYLNAENDYTEAMLSDVKDFRENLYDEIVGRIKQTDMSVPYRDNGYFYYTRYEEGGEYPIYCRKKGTLEADEEIILNVNEMAKDYTYYQVAGYTVSPDNKKVAFGVDTLSRRIYTVYFKDLETGKILEEKIENTTGNATWAGDNKTVFFSVKDEQTLRPYQVFRYSLGQNGEPVLVYQEEDETFNSYVYKTRSKEYIVIGSSARLSDEYRILKADNPTGEFKVFQPREKELEYSIGHFENKFYIRTNLNAKNFRLMETPEDKTTKENWTEVIPHRTDVFLESSTAFKNYLVLEERIKGINKIRIINNKTKEDFYIEFGEDAFTAWVSVNPEFDTNVLRIGYSSLTTPTSTYDYTMDTKEFNLLKRQEVVGGYEPSEYKSERLYATVRDGVEVPISLVYKKGTKTDGSAPLLLYAYGSYGHTIDPYFSSTRLSLLDRGFIFAIAHIRGGQVLGRQWYEDGKMLNKKNTFNDYIDCSKYLIDNKYTKPDKLFAMGGSAGGLLMGAIVNMNPELYKGVVAAVPFVDVVTTMLDESIPLTTGEYDEWGNPNDKEYYDYILSYSPYDNVVAQDYPNMLVTAGYHDSQVQYWEPAKWVAKLREMKTDDNLLLLNTNMEAGHGGASGRFEQYKEVALEYAFILRLVGIKK
ncbi:MAG: S9 family peptidase [Bacteroidales bacterium]|nr:S9 family peptidase [Bacteroidales bacterium]MBN2818725.1 S9 family peptidase [Bacteroidales bacterium]